MSVAEDLGALILKMNPYAGGLMEPHTFLAAPPPRPNTTSGAAPTPPTATATGATPSAPTPTVIAASVRTVSERPASTAAIQMPTRTARAR